MDVSILCNALTALRQWQPLSRQTRGAHASAWANLKGDLQTTNGGFFDELLGGKPEVCATDPSAGAHVDPGSTVVVQLARRC